MSIQNTVTALIVTVILSATGALAVADTTGKAVEHSETAAAVSSARCIPTAIDPITHQITKTDCL